MSLEEHIKQNEKILWRSEIRFVPNAAPYDDLWVTEELILTDQRMLWASGSEILYRAIKDIEVSPIRLPSELREQSGKAQPSRTILVYTQRGNERFEFPDEWALRQVETVIRNALLQL